MKYFIAGVWVFEAIDGEWRLPRVTRALAVDEADYRRRVTDWYVATHKTTPEFGTVGVSLDQTTAV